MIQIFVDPKSKIKASLMGRRSILIELGPVMVMMEQEDADTLASFIRHALDEEGQVKEHDDYLKRLLDNQRGATWS